MVADARPRLAEWLLGQAIQHAAEEGITYEELAERTVRYADLRDRLPDLLRTPLSSAHLDWKRDERDYTAEKRAREAAWERLVYSEVEALRENRASPRLLHGVAWGYLGTLKEHFCGPDPGTLVLRPDPSRGGARWPTRRSPPP